MRRFSELGAAVGVLVALAGLPGAALAYLTFPSRPDLLAVGLAAMLLVSGLAAALSVARGVAPRLRVILKGVYGLTEGDFAWRSGATGRDEISYILRALDDLAGRLEARLGADRAAERHYHLLYDHNPAGLFRTRVDGRVMDCNAAAVRMLGYASALEAKTYNAATFYANPEERRGIVERAVRDGVVGSLPLYFRCKDGRPLPVLLTLVCTHEAGETYLDGMFVDITLPKSEGVGSGGNRVEVPA